MSSDDKGLWSWAVLSDTSIWQRHGQQVADTTPYLPGLFGRPPRNPALKISSGYKAWEFLTYVYGLAPALLYGMLPNLYWRNFCKLCAGLRILHQHQISVTQLKCAHQLLIEFLIEYETIYYQCQEDCLHFCRPSIHAVSHLALETY